MNIERIRKIIAYSNSNHEEIYSCVKQFCSFAGIGYDNEVLNILQIVRSAFNKKNYLVLEIPFKDDEICAMSYKADGLGYVVINTSLPKVNVNFALAHEVYHVFFKDDEVLSKVEFTNDNYYEQEDEFAANLFAGMLLMPEISFRRMYTKFNAESKGDKTDTIIRLMSYYEVPYMSILIRCLELNLFEDNILPDEILNFSRNQIKNKLTDLWLDQSLMNALKVDDFSHIEKIVSNIGNEYIKDEYINERTLNKVLQNMRKLYIKIKGE